jgi:hypothetical protein
MKLKEIPWGYSQSEYANSVISNPKYVHIQEYLEQFKNIKTINPIDRDRAIRYRLDAAFGNWKLIKSYPKIPGVTIFPKYRNAKLVILQPKYFTEIYCDRGIVCSQFRNISKTKIYKSGNVYDGDFLNNQRTGKGIFRWNNGNVYDGDFLNNQRTGKGIFRWNNGNVYEGDFLNDKCTGKGVLRWVDGCVHEGGFLNGMRNGKGKFKFSDGDIYVGTFKNGDIS